MGKLPPGKILLSDRIKSVLDMEGQYDMARGLIVSVEPCVNPECGYDEEPNFIEQRRVSFRQVGEPGDYSYSRSISVVQEVLVCLACGEVHKVLRETK